VSVTGDTIALSSPPRPGRRVIAVIATLAALALVAWLAFGRGGDSAALQGRPQAAGVDQLRALSASVGHDVYWAGSPGTGESIELTHAKDGRIYVRYLSGDGAVGDDRAQFTTIGTYPVPEALAALRRQARGPEAITRDLANGGFAYLSVDKPTSVYLAWPNSGYEVEVYDPSPKHALDLVLDGSIQPVH
jgi:hypothetical protein